MILVLRTIIVTILFYPVISQAQAQSDEQNLVRVNEFIASIEPRFADMQGGAIAILHKDNLIYKKTFGFKKGKTGPITEHTLFPLASVSKAVTATSLSLMSAKGEIDLNIKYKLPYIKPKVSLINLLSHTTGYNYYGNSDIEKGLSRARLLTILQKHKPRCAPGACYHYTNLVFSLVEEVLKQENISLAVALAELRTTLGTNEIQIIPITKGMEVAIPHIKTKTGFEPIGMPPYYPKAAASASGIFASLSGMVELYKLLFGYRKDLIPPADLNKIFEIKLTNSDTKKFATPYPQNDIESYYGLGMRIWKINERRDSELMFHSGYIAGVNTFFGSIPSKEIGIIILLNNRSDFAVLSGFNLWKRLVN